MHQQITQRPTAILPSGSLTASPPSVQFALFAHPLLAQFLADEAVDALLARRLGGGDHLRLAADDLEHQLAADRGGELIGGPHHDQEGAGPADDAILVIDIEIADRGEARLAA